ncbi:MAG: ImmA/IrrE family metallo-endopeptidase [gamma proteobacterium symbiont of Taylorina sp.]|nr:ImmA/IrrE family metallo-endopeptidase [gamma proteobacterium symbiont of Taylorina sp.]
MAHEIGHVCMHIMSKTPQIFECGDNEINNLHNDPKELEANGFAAGLLMPEYLITDLTDNNLNWLNIKNIVSLRQYSSI